MAQAGAKGKGMDALGNGPVWALGLMSGTSLDGIDAAMVLTDGETVAATGSAALTAYDPADLVALPAVMADPLRHRDGTAPQDRAGLAAAEAEVLRLHARATVDLLCASEEQPALVGFHGQTLAHDPEAGWTWQLGDGARLARALNRPVVWDFRTADMAAGGEGAPLAPFYHFALARWKGLAGPVAFLNLGGVANITWVDPDAPAPEAPGALVAFDTGPGNALINDWMLRHTGEPLDASGAAAARGDPAAVSLTTNFVGSYLARPGPKSLDRNGFAMLAARLEGARVEDGAAVLTQFTVDCATAALPHLPRPPARWLVCGGGRHNATMMGWLAEAVAAPVDPVEAIGLDGDMLEAEAFAYLAVRVARGLPTSAPGTTGCARPVCGGRLSRP